MTFSFSILCRRWASSMSTSFPSAAIQRGRKEDKGRRVTEGR
jgi:hypothetical protein